MTLEVVPTDLPGVLVLQPRVFRDARGFFLETYSARAYREAGIPAEFVQDNFSRSAHGTLRGLHFQEPDAQGKLCSVSRGKVWDVAVDVRRGSPTFGKWTAVELDDVSLRRIWIPPGFAHGFCVVSDVADFHYKCTAPYAPASERAVRWDDPALAIPWPLAEAPVLSARDAAAPLLADAPVLPAYQS